LGRKIGSVSAERWRRLQAHEAQIERAQSILPAQFHQGTTLEQLLRRPETTWLDVCGMSSDLAALDLTPLAAEQVVLETKYAGYIRRQQAQIERRDQTDAVAIPDQFDYSAVLPLRAEAKQKLLKVKPRDLGQASRISGITPADIAILILYVKEPHRLAPCG
jgi:tRNA uridine 5-carboxymethylaminomethyl modification enzyme